MFSFLVARPHFSPQIMKEKHATLDLAYLRQSAPMLGVADLLEKALNDASL